jgi:hypothetical protein
MGTIDCQFEGILGIGEGEFDYSHQVTSAHASHLEILLIESTRVLRKNECIVPVHLCDRHEVVTTLELLAGLMEQIEEVTIDLLQTDEVCLGIGNHAHYAVIPILHVVSLEPDVVGQQSDCIRFGVYSYADVIAVDMGL